MKLRLIFLFLVAHQALFAQFDFKLEHTYDSLLVKRVQLQFSKKIRYIGRIENYDSLKRWHTGSPIYKIYDENHRLLKRVESTYPLERDTTSRYPYDKSLAYIGESATGKLIFYERISATNSLAPRIIDEDGNVAQIDNIYNFTIDSTEDISPKAIKASYELNNTYKIQYYSYPELRFEKEYIYQIDLQNRNIIGQIPYRKKFLLAGEKFVFLLNDSTLQLLNPNHTVWKEIKLKIPLGFSIKDLGGRLDFITQDSDSVFKILYTVTKWESIGLCNTFRVKYILTDENMERWQEEEYVAVNGPSNLRCRNESWGTILQIQGDKLFYNNIGTDGANGPDFWNTKIVDRRTMRVDTVFKNSITSSPKIVIIGKKTYFTWDNGDSTKFYDKDFNYKFTTVLVDYSVSYISDTLVNKDSLLEWFTFDTLGQKAINQRGQNLFSCYRCSPPILSIIRNSDDKLIFQQYDVDGGRKTFVYSKNITSSINNKRENIAHFKVFPNPFSNTINIENLADNLDPLSIQIISTNGQVVFRNNYKTQSININELAVLPSGLYFIRIENDKKESEIFKIMKF